MTQAQTQTKPIGTDAYFREIFPGDTIQDAEGRRYFILENGGCKPTNGGNETTLSRIDEPVVVTDKYRQAKSPDTSTSGPKVVRQDRVRLCKLAAEANITTLHAARILTAAGVPYSGHAIDILSVASEDVPAAREAIRNAPAISLGDDDETSAVKEQEKNTRKPRKGAIKESSHTGRPNRSGIVRIDFLTKMLGLPSRGAIQIVRESGLQIAYGPSKNPGVRIEDKARALEILAENKDTLLKRQEQAPARVTKLTVLTDPAKTTRTRSPRAKAKTATNSTTSVRSFTDQQLVSELRRRGWLVDCKKCESI